MASGRPRVKWWRYGPKPWDCRRKGSLTDVQIALTKSNRGLFRWMSSELGSRNSVRLSEASHQRSNTMDTYPDTRRRPLHAAEPGLFLVDVCLG